MRFYFFAFCLSILCLSQVNAQIQAISLVDVEGTAVIYVQPDEIILNITISEQDKSHLVVRQLSKSNTQKVLSYLQSKGIKSKHIQTKFLTIGPRFKYKTNEVNYFEATQKIAICITDISRYDEILDGLFELGINRVSSPTFVSSKMIDIKNKARKIAIKKAKAKATLLAGELGQQIGKAHTIKELNYSVGSFANSYTSTPEVESPDFEEGMSFAPGQIEVKSTVKVSFILR